MTNKKIYFLNQSDVRPMSEALTWLRDAWILLHKNIAQWMLFSLSAIIFFSFVIMLMTIFLALMQNALQNIIFALAIIAIELTSISIQCGIYFSIKNLIADKKINLLDIFIVFRKKQRLSIWMYLSFSLLFTMFYYKIERHFLTFDSYYQLFNSKADLLLFLKLRFIYFISFMSLSWAIIPMIVDFKDISFFKMFASNAKGTLKNITGLLFLLLIIMALLIVFILLLLALRNTIAPLAIILFALAILLGIPFIGATLFSAYRHIFTNW